MEMNKDCTCKCSEFAPLMSKYMNSGDNEDIIKREMYNPAYGHLPNIDRYPTSNNDGKLVTLSKSANDLQSIVKEGYTSPIKLDTYFKLGEAKLVRLDIDNKNGEAKLVPLEIDKKTGEAKLVTLDVNAKSGEAQLVRLDVDEKTGKAKLVGLEIPKLTGNSKLVILDTEDKTILPKLIELSVDHKTGEAKLIRLDVEVKSGKSQLIRLDVPEIEGKAKLVGLEVENKRTSSKLIPLKVDEKLSSPKMIILDVTNKSAEPKLVNLKVDEIEGKAKLVGLEVNPITGESKLIKLNVPEMEGKSKLVKLEVNPLSGEAKLVRLNVPEIEGKAKLVGLDVTNKSAEPELVKLHIENKEGEPKLVELSTNDKRVTNRLLNLGDTIGYSDIYEVPNVTEKSANPKLINLEVTEKSSEPKLIGLNVDDKIADPKLVILNIDEKTGEPKLVKLNVTELTKKPKLVILEVDPIIGQARLVKLDVPKLTGSVKLVELHVDEKTKEPKLVELEVTEKLAEPKIIELHVDKKVSDPKVIKLVVTEESTSPKLIELNVEEKSTEPKRIDLNVEEKIGKVDVIDLPADSGTQDDLSDKYVGEYIPGTTIPMHRRSANSIVTPNPTAQTDDEITKLSPEALDKYSKTAAWMGIPGKIGIQAAADYESIMTILDSMNYQLGGGEAAIERMKSYLTAAADGKGVTVNMPNHQSDLKFSDNQYIRLMGGQLMSMIGSANGAISKALKVSMSALTGDMEGLIGSIGSSSGSDKAYAIHKALMALRTMVTSKLQHEPRNDGGALPGTGAFNGGSNLGGKLMGDVMDSLTTGNIKSAAKNAASSLIGAAKDAIFGKKDKAVIDHPDPLNVPEAKNFKNGYINSDFKSEKGSVFGNVNTSIASFKRFNTPGMSMTLRELCSKDDVPQSFDELLSALKSKYSVITNFHNHFNALPYKTEKNIGAIGLDSNHNWEVTLEPLIDKTLNGGFTYLPSMNMMNRWNKNAWGITTGYGRWLPFTSFELQDKKITSKSLNLFDGGITYPVSMEFTNELRLTLVDDQLKTFRRYFDTVSRVSAFDSKPYTDPDQDHSPGIDENKPNVSSYKNVTFICTIYMMNNEFSTIKRFPLLVTLADYQVEYTGETSEGGNDLALHFSIVGTLDRIDLERVNSYYNNKISKSKSMDKPLSAANPNNSLSSTIPPSNPTAGLNMQKINVTGYDHYQTTGYKSYE